MSYDLGADNCIRKPVDLTQFTEAAEHLAPYWLMLDEAAPPADG